MEERIDELTVAIAYNNQLSAVEYSSCVDLLRLFFRLSFAVVKIVSNLHKMCTDQCVLDVLHSVVAYPL